MSTACSSRPSSTSAVITKVSRLQASLVENAVPGFSGSKGNNSNTVPFTLGEAVISYRWNSQTRVQNLSEKTDVTDLSVLLVVAKQICFYTYTPLLWSSILTGLWITRRFRVSLPSHPFCSHKYTERKGISEFREKQMSQSGGYKSHKYEEHSMN